VEITDEAAPVAWTVTPPVYTSAASMTTSDTLAQPKETASVSVKDISIQYGLAASALLLYQCGNLVDRDLNLTILCTQLSFHMHLSYSQSYSIVWCKSTL
jgi:hypothetical protein